MAQGQGFSARHQKREYEYDDLVVQAEVLKKKLNSLYANADLKDEPDMEEVNRLLIGMREDYYFKI
ncbi:MAG: hypothetical protein WDO19_19825 [Bacteroidota bacterium]